jgi:spermidine synthase
MESNKRSKVEQNYQFIDEGPDNNDELLDGIKGQRFGLQVKALPIFEEKSKFQQISIYESKSYGKVLVLDDVIQVTEKDEFAYHEMLVHVPLFAYLSQHATKSRSRKQESRTAKFKVLLIGAGDGGALRELCKHSMVS